MAERSISPKYERPEIAITDTEEIHPFEVYKTVRRWFQRKLKLIFSKL